MVTVLKAREASIKMTTADITVPPSAALDTETNLASASADTTMKNITFVLPQGTVDKIDLLGETSNFQNQEIEEKSYGMATVSGTLILDGGAENTILLLMAGAGTAAGSYTRYQFGSSASGKTRVKVGAILLNLTNGIVEANVLLDNVYVTKFGDIKVTGPDGHWECDFEAMCLPKNFYIEFKD